MHKQFLFLCFVLFSFQVHAQTSCRDLPERFSSYTDAIKAIKEVDDFEYKDEVADGTSSWMMSIEYLSCDGNFGYFIFSSDKGNGYIHVNVPKAVWIEFKKSISKADFYDTKIKKKFKLISSL